MNPSVQNHLGGTLKAYTKWIQKMRKQIAVLNASLQKCDSDDNQNEDFDLGSIHQICHYHDSLLWQHIPY
eukprot:13549617-Ditylum_brightwellii.AAC.1